jgi:hypothetical protein
MHCPCISVTINPLVSQNVKIYGAIVFHVIIISSNGVKSLVGGRDADATDELGAWDMQAPVASTWGIASLHLIMEYYPRQI